MPGVDAFVRQPTFVLLDLADDGAVVCATPTTSSRGAGGSEGEPLTAVTLNDECAPDATRRFCQTGPHGFRSALQ